MRRIVAVFGCLILLSLHVKAQIDTISYADFIESVLISDQEEVSIGSLYIPRPNEYEFKKADSIIQSIDTIYHAINISDVEFAGQTGTLYRGINLDSIYFKKLFMANINGDVYFHPTNCVFNDGFMGGTESESYLGFDNCLIKGQLRIWLKDQDNSTGGLSIKNSEILLSKNGAYIETHSGTINLQRTKIWAPDSLIDQRWLHLNIKSEIFILHDCDINVKVDFSLGSEVTHELYVAENKLSNISISQLNIPEVPFSSQIPWNGIHSAITAHYFKNGKIVNIKNDNNSAISIEEVYLDLHGTMYMLYSLYKAQGRLEYANPAYAKLKEFETRRWKFLHKQNKSFESYFRWKLNVFLSYFTDYGTNPAKAVVKSGWVILLFAIFYLFFPSDWDVTNRSQLLKRTKELFSKNRERSFIWTLGFVAYSSLIYALNALTLSMNAFTTLGFGDIPTHGAARYVTIVQGFIGWFLLTIFSVSLINQVLG